MFKVLNCGQAIYSLLQKRRNFKSLLRPCNSSNNKEENLQKTVWVARDYCLKLSIIENERILLTTFPVSLPLKSSESFVLWPVLTVDVLLLVKGLSDGLSE
jgi:hypothetical protein